MTTIAFDGRTLAADRGSLNGIVRNEVTKLFDIQLCDEARDILGFSSSHIWYAAAGSGQYVHLVKKWMIQGGILPKYPDDNGCVIGIIVEVDTGYCYELGVTPTNEGGVLSVIQYEKFPIASGGGDEMALGAMLAGADARKAIEIVESRTYVAWGGIDSFTLSDEVIVKRKENINNTSKILWECPNLSLKDIYSNG